MKKFLLSSIAIFALFAVSQSQIKVGLVTGRSLAIQERSDAGDERLISTDAFRGYHVGLTADIHLLGNIYAQPQLLYSQKGAKFTSKTGGWEKITNRTIEVPLNVVYKADLLFAKLYAGGGPVINYGIGGKSQLDQQTTRLYKGASNYRRLDLSANAVAGLEFRNGLFVSVNYQYGLRDVNKTSVNVKNRSFGVSIGQTIEWKKNKS
ncbi:MAG: PorT family protein [Chitinophagaceae bacterium]|nr:PorT family protein [Chitinophagaceae bacterium]